MYLCFDRLITKICNLSYMNADISWKVTGCWYLRGLIVYIHNQTVYLSNDSIWVTDWPNIGPLNRTKNSFSKKIYQKYWHRIAQNVGTWWRHQMEHFPRYWPFVRGIHRSPVNSPHKGQWRGALMFSLICVWINDWVNNRAAGDVRRYLTH